MEKKLLKYDLSKFCNWYVKDFICKGGRDKGMHFFKRYQIISSFMPKICISDQSKQNLWEVIQKWPLTSLLVREVNRKSISLFENDFTKKKRKIAIGEKVGENSVKSN